MGDIDSNLPVKDATDGTIGATAPTLADQVGGKDGSGNLQAISVDTTGKVNVNNISGTVSLPTGASTSALQTTGNTSLSSIDTKTPTVGQKTMANSSPVVIASDQSAIPASQSGTWNINNVSGTVSLPTGASTSILQTTGNSSLSSIDSKVPANLTVTSTRLLVDGSGVTQPISAVSLPLPTGASTSALQTSGGQKTQVVDSSGNSISSNKYSSAYGLQTYHMDGPQLDNLQRMRVSETSTIISLSFSNSSQSLSTASSTVGAATITSNPTVAAMQLVCSTASADSAILQTKYISYAAGRSYMTMFSGNIGAKKVNVRQRVGYFDASDGMFFEQTGTDLAVVVRTSTSGSVVDTRVLQANWNLDKLDGTGSSGFTLDTSKHNLYIIDFIWLGAGRVRWGVDIGGKVIYCHEFAGGNVATVPYTRTACLPVRAEITNTGTAASSTTLSAVCFNVQRESQDDPDSTAQFSQSRGVTVLATTGTTKPLICIRPKTTFNGITNRIPVVPVAVQTLAGSQNTFIQIILNPTLTGAAFTSADTLSAVEYDVTASAVTGGTVLQEYYVPAGTVALSPLVLGNIAATLADFVLGLNVAGTTADILCIAATSLAGGTNTLGSISWEEYQ